MCILREEEFNQIGCLQNATAGEEFRRGWHPELYLRTDQAHRPVLVVGGGPAGLECAIVLGKRGFEAVHLAEAEDSLGGKLRWTRRLPTLGDWGRVIDHRLITLGTLPNVTTILNQRMTAAAVLDYGAELVIITTGSSWAGDGTQPGAGPHIAGADLAFTPEQIMGGAEPRPGRVIVYDTDGYYVGPGIAEHLRDRGFEVHIVTPHDRVSPVSDLSLEGHMLRQHLHDRGIAFHTGVVMNSICGTEVAGTTEFGDPWSLPADGVVLVTHQRSHNALYSELLARQGEWSANGIRAVYAAGDALAPRMPSEAIFDGHRLAREIDENDPMTAKPIRTERPAW